jgi:hypothetical protein
MADFLLDDGDDDLLLDSPGWTEGLRIHAADDAPGSHPPAPDLALMEILPANFPLPWLLKFVPDVRLKTALDVATQACVGLEVVGDDGLKAADVALAEVRDRVKAVKDHFAEPAARAHELHSSITARRAEWLVTAEAALQIVGRRVAAERARLQAIADEARRTAQEAANREAQARLRAQAEAAERQKAPARVVEQLKLEAETATAPPVPPPATAPVPMTRNTVVTTWKARIKGTSAEADPNPGMAELDAGQVEQIRALMRAVADGTESIACFELDWGYLNRRAKSEERAFKITGLEAFPDSTTRGKPGRKGRTDGAV